MELFDKLSQGEALIESAILVQIKFNSYNSSGRSGRHDEQQDIHEFTELVRSAGANTSTLVTGSRASPDSRYFVGSGKADEIKTAVHQHDADVVIFDLEGPVPIHARYLTLSIPNPDLAYTPCCLPTHP